MKSSLIITCAGTGSRAKLGYNKMLYKHNNEYLFNITLKKFLDYDFSEIFIVYNKVDYNIISDNIITDSRIKLIQGGNTRQESVKLAVSQVTDSDIIFIHDGARPNISKHEINSLFDFIKNDQDFNACALCLNIYDSVRRIKDDKIVQIEDRDSLVLLQTPQVVKTSLLKELLNNSDVDYTDETALLVANNIYPTYIKGSRHNFKITAKEDLGGINELL